MKAWTFRAALVAVLLLARATWGAESQEKLALETWWKHFEKPLEEIRGGVIHCVPLLSDTRRAAAAIADCEATECEQRKAETVCVAALAVIGVVREWKFYAEHKDIERGMPEWQIAEVCPLPLSENEVWWGIIAKHAERAKELGILRTGAHGLPLRASLHEPAVYYLLALADILANCGKAGDALKLLEIAEPLVGKSKTVIPTEPTELFLNEKSLAIYMRERWMDHRVVLEATKLAARAQLRRIQKRAVLHINPSANIEVLDKAAEREQERMAAILEPELKRIQARRASAQAGGETKQEEEDDDDLPKPNYSGGASLGIPTSERKAGKLTDPKAEQRRSYDFSSPRPRN